MKHSNPMWAMLLLDANYPLLGHTSGEWEQYTISYKCPPCVVSPCLMISTWISHIFKEYQLPDHRFVREKLRRKVLATSQCTAAWKEKIWS